MGGSVWLVAIGCWYVTLRPITGHDHYTMVQHTITIMRLDILDACCRVTTAHVGVHKLFDEINEAVEEYVDLIAEPAVQLGGVAHGTAAVVAARSTLPEYPLVLSTGAEHLAALSDALAGFGRTVRVGIDEMSDLDDADSADVLTEISRGVDKWLWFVEAHQQGPDKA
jgi:DNA-binding ferritin-like protein